jgi:5-methylcytosine-specific restriction enzyme A
MGLMPLKKCAEVGCSELVRKPRCDEHRRVRDHERSLTQARQTRSSVAWQRVRAEKRRVDPCCEDCRARGVLTPTQEIHHVRSLSEAPELALEMSNLRSLCVSCHDKYSTLKTKGMPGESYE